jgi:hypothetical protein
VYNDYLTPYPLSISWRGVHPEGIHPEGDKGGEVKIATLLFLAENIGSYVATLLDKAFIF